MAGQKTQNKLCSGTTHSQQAAPLAQCPVATELRTDRISQPTLSIKDLVNAPNWNLPKFFAPDVPSEITGDFQVLKCSGAKLIDRPRSKSLSLVELDIIKRAGLVPRISFKHARPKRPILRQIASVIARFLPGGLPAANLVPRHLMKRHLELEPANHHMRYGQN